LEFSKHETKGDKREEQKGGDKREEQKGGDKREGTQGNRRFPAIKCLYYIAVKYVNIYK